MHVKDTKYPNFQLFPQGQMIEGEYAVTTYNRRAIASF